MSGAAARTSPTVAQGSRVRFAWALITATAVRGLRRVGRRRWGGEHHIHRGRGARGWCCTSCSSSSRSERRPRPSRTPCSRSKTASAASPDASSSRTRATSSSASTRTWSEDRAPGTSQSTSPCPCRRWCSRAVHRQRTATAHTPQYDPCPSALAGRRRSTVNSSCTRIPRPRERRAGSSTPTSSRDSPAASGAPRSSPAGGTRLLLLARRRVATTDPAAWRDVLAVADAVIGRLEAHERRAAR